MASIIRLKDKTTKKYNGRRAVQFEDQAGHRQTLFLGKVSEQAAKKVAGNVDALVRSVATGTTIRGDVLAWAMDLQGKVAEKLTKFGLLDFRRKPADATLGAFLDSYIKSRTDAKKSTTTTWGNAKRCLIEYFGADKPLAEISEGDADDWRLWLGQKGGANKKGLADNTVRRRSAVAKQFFRAAVKRRLISESPFAGMKGCLVRENRSRDYFLSKADAYRILEACPDAQWRLIFALSRFGGLRCPSEHLRLRLSDVNWERDRFTVHAPKKEHLGQEHATRQVPIFPELRPYLQEAWDNADEGDGYLITRYRDAGQNLRTQLERIIKRAGLEAWPKLFQNLRATRATELVAEGWPEYKVCKWIGHTEAIAKKHYWQVTEEDFAEAAGAAPRNPMQNPMQQVGFLECKSVQQERENPEKHGISRVSRGLGVGRTGLEHTANSPQNTLFNPAGIAESYATPATSPSVLDLTALTDEQRAAVLAIIQGVAVQR